jgi:hypothetical protein
MLNTIRIHKGEMLENGLRRAFHSMNKPPCVDRVAKSEYDMGHFLVFVAEVCRFDGPGKDLWKRRRGGWRPERPELLSHRESPELSVLYTTIPPS